MSALMHPVGPRSAAVYWRRRAVVLVALIAVVALVLVVGNAVLGRSSATGATAEPTTEESAAEPEAAAEPDDTADGPVGCTPDQLSLTLAADAQAYPAGSDPVFTVALTNTGDASCTLDASEVNRQILVSSGSDRIWASNDCPADTEERILLLAAGARDEVAVTWPRIRSDEACSADLPEPRAGTYTAVVTIGDTMSPRVVFQLQ